MSKSLCIALNVLNYFFQFAIYDHLGTLHEYPFLQLLNNSGSTTPRTLDDQPHFYRNTSRMTAVDRKRGHMQTAVP